MVNIFYLDSNPNKCATYYCNKHVNKIMIEILQILSYIFHEEGLIKPPYKKTRSINTNLAPYKWAKKSLSNYKYCVNLADALCKEYKYRYNKHCHASESVIEFFKNNIPKNFNNKNKTEFLFTDNIKIYKKYFNSIDASRYYYIDFKCINDNWGIRGKPNWWNKYLKKSSENKQKLIDKINNNVRIKLPQFSIKNKLKTRRFHSFLRICYDNMFGGKWIDVIKTMKNMFNPNKPLISQLGYAHLLEVYNISNSLFDIKTYEKLNNNSLKWRNKLIK